MANSISLLTVNTLQSHFINALNASFGLIGHYAIDLFYLIAVIEIAIFGLMWALKREDALADFIMKILKLGVIFFVIIAFPYLLKALIDGFSQIAFKMGPHAVSYIFNPAKIFKFGFDAGLSLLKLAATYGTANMGMAQIYVVLGFGILLIFGLIVAQIVLIVVAFYVVSLLALLVLPFGAFTPTKNLFEQSLGQVFKAGARVFALILVIGIGVGILSQFSIKAYSIATTLDKPLGLFFISLIILILTIRLPHFAAQVIGKISGGILNDIKATPIVNVSSPAANSFASMPGQSAQASVGVTNNVVSGPQAVSAATTLGGNTVVSSPSVSVATSIKSTANDLTGKSKRVQKGAEIKKS